MRKNLKTIQKVITNYLHRNPLVCKEEPCWEIRNSELGGLGLFARRSIQTGEIIFTDSPLVLGPRLAQSNQTCATCYKNKNLEKCKKSCGLLLCSEECQKNHERECRIKLKWQNVQHSNEILLQIRLLLLNDEDKLILKCLQGQNYPNDIEEDEYHFIQFASSVINTNAFEVPIENGGTIKGLYPLASFMNHSCTPNTFHVFTRNHQMILRASTPIPEDSEILHCYTRLTWGTLVRQFYLMRTKQFLCKCSRCEDPTEFGCYLSAIWCKTCKYGKVIRNKCENCGKVASPKEIASVSSLLSAAVNSFTNEDLPLILKCIVEKLPELVPKSNEAIVELKYRVIWILGHQRNFAWKDLPKEQIYVKMRYCNDLLTILQKLRLGQCRMRGLLQYELYCCLKELKKRNVHAKDLESTMENLFLSAADILKFDIGAPEKIQRFWKNEIKT